DLRNILPTAAIERLHESREADVVDDRLPVEWELEIAQALADDAFDVVFLRQQNRFRYCYTKLSRQRIIEELIISGPPKRVVDNHCAFERHPFECRAIKRHFMRNAID